jgi:integrase
LQQAIAIGYLHSNPTTACELPKAERKDTKPLDDDAIRAFMGAIQGNRFEVLYLVTLFTGLRRGEVCGLT